MKKVVDYILVGLFSFVSNFLIYNFSFNSQATPFLHEEQRVESAISMLKITVPAYFAVAALVTLAFYLVAKINSKS